MKIDGDDVLFSTGRRVYANNGIIGLSPELEVYEGYDGGFASSMDNELTQEERVELADYMIGQWTRFRSTICDGD